MVMKRRTTKHVVLDPGGFLRDRSGEVAQREQDCREFVSGRSVLPNKLNGITGALWGTQIALICYRIGTLLVQADRANIGGGAGDVTPVMNPLKDTTALRVDQQNLLRACENALSALGAG
jgi:hypothetical protein